MMTEIYTTDGGQKDALLKRANITKKMHKLNPQKKSFIVVVLSCLVFVGQFCVCIRFWDHQRKAKNQDKKADQQKSNFKKLL